jgi:hypothetical protein
MFVIHSFAAETSPHTKECPQDWTQSKLKRMKRRMQFKINSMLFYTSSDHNTDRGEHVEVDALLSLVIVF